MGLADNRIELPAPARDGARVFPRGGKAAQRLDAGRTSIALRPVAERLQHLKRSSRVTTLVIIAALALCLSPHNGGVMQKIGIGCAALTIDLRNLFVL